MEPGNLIAGRYRLEERLAAGGMGAVWRGTDTRLNRVVAVKLLHSGLSGNDRFRARFHQEAQAVAQLQSPGIVSLYDYGEETRPGGARLLPHHGARARTGARQRAAPAGPPVPQRDAEDHGVRGRGARRGAPGAHHPPRHQAGEPARQLRRQRQDRRLRHRRGQGRRRAHRDRHRHGHPRLRLARAAPGLAADRFDRPVLAGHRRLRGPRRAAPVRGERAHGRDRRAPHRHARAAAARRPRPSRPDHHALLGEGPAPAVRLGRRARAGVPLGRHGRRDHRDAGPGLAAAASPPSPRRS